MKPTLPEPEIIDKHLPTGVVIRGYTAETVQRLIDEAYSAGLEDAENPGDDRKAFESYLTECDECAIVPDVAGAFAWAWRAIKQTKEES